MSAGTLYASAQCSNILRRIGAALLVAVSAVACGSQARSDPQAKATVAIIGVSSSIWPAMVALKKGFFAQHGLNVDVVTVGSSSRVLQDVTAGAADVGGSSLVDTFRAVDSGASVKLFLASQVVGPYRLIASKNIKSVSDLRGKRIMTGGSKDITNLWWETIAKHYGLDPNKDVQLFFSGSSGNRTSALLAGGVDAAVLSTPQTFQLIKQGWTDLGSAAPYLGEFPTMGWAVNSKWAKAHPTLVIAFARAHDEAVRYMMDPANKIEVSTILADEAHLSLDDALQTWEVSARDHAFAFDGKISSKALQLVRSTLLAGGDLESPGKSIDAFYVDSYAKAALK